MGRPGPVRETGHGGGARSVPFPTWRVRMTCADLSGHGKKDSSARPILSSGDPLRPLCQHLPAPAPTTSPPAAFRRGRPARRYGLPFGLVDVKATGHRTTHWRSQARRNWVARTLQDALHCSLRRTSPSGRTAPPKMQMGLSRPRLFSTRFRQSRNAAPMTAFSTSVGRPALQVSTHSLKSSGVIPGGCCSQYLLLPPASAPHATATPSNQC